MTQPDAIPAAPAGIDRLRFYYERNERRIAVVAFAVGFLFDVLTFGRVDSWLAIGQQVLYLAVITTALTQMFLEQGRPPLELGTMSAVRRWYYQGRTALVHFLFGSLLNLYTIYFFKSSSLLVSFSFLAFLVLVLVANETRRFKSLGLPFKFALLGLCGLSFVAHVVPIFVGSIGVAVFLLSMLLGALPLVGLGWGIRAFAPGLFQRARRQILVPAGAVLLGFLTLYLVKVIPPVPLSIPFIGVYHAVERTDEGYRLSHERPLWRIWHNGDQDFRAQPGDRVYVFFRIFSPTRFSDQVLMRWYHRSDGARGWSLTDSIPIGIVGGREQGFRGYGVKSNHQPGDWKVQVETTDGREIGRVYFRLESAPEAPRSFVVELQ
ncbi:MAG: DUF2914 domain-containing protein [Burkholderiales bacterium]